MYIYICIYTYFSYYTQYMEMYPCWWIYLFLPANQSLFQLEQTGHSVSRHVCIHIQLYVICVYILNIYMYTCRFIVYMWSWVYIYVHVNDLLMIQVLSVYSIFSNMLHDQCLYMYKHTCFPGTYFLSVTVFCNLFGALRPWILGFYLQWDHISTCICILDVCFWLDVF